MKTLSQLQIYCETKVTLFITCYMFGPEKAIIRHDNKYESKVTTY